MSRSSELPGDISKYLGVSEETVQKWKEQGKINPIPLPSGVRRATQAEVVRGSVAYEPFPESVLRAAIESADLEKRENS
jgi:predicted site-specific integrase-resolvase